MDTETHHVYSSKFAIHVLDLKQINNASSEDKHWGLDNWAKLFKAATWEDVKMIAANNKYLTEAANTMYELYSDREMRRQMENREDFIRRQKRDQRMLKDQADIIAEKDSALARQADEIARLRAQIIDGAVCEDHIHLSVAIPPKISISSFMGYLKGKSTLMIYDRHPELQSKWDKSFWARGYYVSTIGNITEDAIKKYIQEQSDESRKEENRSTSL